MRESKNNFKMLTAYLSLHWTQNMVNNSLKQGKMLSILARWVLLDACMHVVFLMKEEDAQEPVVTCFEFGFHSSVSLSDSLLLSDWTVASMWNNAHF